MKNVIFLMMLFVGTSCVITTTRTGPPTRVETQPLEPRVSFASRSKIKIWVYPRHNVRDAVIIANNHCGQYGATAQPRGNWSRRANRRKLITFYCSFGRPVVTRPRGRRPVVVRPPARRPVVNPTVVRQPVVISRPPVRRPTIANPPSNPPVVRQPVIINRPPAKEPAIAPPPSSPVVDKPVADVPSSGNSGHDASRSKGPQRPWTGLPPGHTKDKSKKNNGKGSDMRAPASKKKKKESKSQRPWSDLPPGQQKKNKK